MHACPKDKSTLSDKVIQGHLVSYCNGCSGLWLPHSFVFKACGREFTPFRTSANARPTRLVCPEDGGQLLAVHHRGVEIDLCNFCGGVWVDRGELEQIEGLVNPMYAGMPISETSSNWKLDGLEFVGEGVCTVVEFVFEALSGL